MCRRVVGPVVAAALMVGAMGLAPARAAETAGTSDPRPVDYVAQASKAVDYINAHRGVLAKSGLEWQLDGALALVASGRRDTATQATLNVIKDSIKVQGPSYCTSKYVGGCAKVTITLLAAGEPTTYGAVSYTHLTLPTKRIV